jgi:CRISPR-associated endonuclease/helicase Cas3
MTVNPNWFSDFFREVYRTTGGRSIAPFPWQERLAAQVCQGGEWPQVLALPTGSGKTTCIDIAVFALACQADRPTSERTAPRRILFVVDRRVIVHEAFRHAMELAQRLYAAKDGILKKVADALRAVGCSDIPLTCHELRGGMYRDDAWARSPCQPCVIASTVDQVGSRLLFRGYGRSFKSWPVLAGLAGNDVLILLDEAHCANPFRQTVQAVTRYRGGHWAQKPLRNPFHLVIMSATPPEDLAEATAPAAHSVHMPATHSQYYQPTFTLDQRDHLHQILSVRLSASKPTRLVVAKAISGSNVYHELAVALVEQAIESVSNQRRAVAIMVNRVRTARLVDALLEAFVEQGNSDAAWDARLIKRLRDQLRRKSIETFDRVLMIGRMRPIDRQGSIDEWLERLNLSAAEHRDLDRPVFVTATQCLEVGANLDFDALVTECASLDALRQRFGRLNRAGRPIEASGCVVIRRDQTNDTTDDPIYGPAIAATWQQLNRWAQQGNGIVDFGVQRMTTAWQSLPLENRRELLSPAPDAPIMLPAHIDCWVQTSPSPEPSPDVSLFLHGPQRSAPDVLVCWRSDLPHDAPWPIAEEARPEVRQFERRVIDAVSLCPPTPLECMPVPLYVMVRWLTRREDSGIAFMGDLETSSFEKMDGAGAPISRVGLIWRGPQESMLLRDPAQVRPGDTVVLPASVGGWDVLGYIPPTLTHAVDVADQCHWKGRRRAVLRLHPELVKLWPETDNRDRATILELITAWMEDPDQLDRDELRSTLVERLKSLIGSQATPSTVGRLGDRAGAQADLTWLAEAFEQNFFRHDAVQLLPHPFGGLVLRSRRAAPASHAVFLDIGETFSTEDDTASATKPTRLCDHLYEVSQQARAYAEKCHLDSVLTNSLELAGWLHDTGKADSRFQAFLFGGNRLAACLTKTLFAKSDGLVDDQRTISDAWSRAALPENFRHEVLSLQLAERYWQKISALIINSRGVGPDSTNNCFNAKNIDWDLVLHLITMHHGYGRPLVPIVDDRAATDDDLSLILRFDSDQQSLKIEGSDRRKWPVPHRIDSGIAQRFWGLVRRYGWWGLAWLEAMLVLADHRVSERPSAAS